MDQFSSSLAILLQPDPGQIVGLWNTVVGGGCSLSSPGYLTGQYPYSEIPRYAFDTNKNTKYMSFGNCPTYPLIPDLSCGLNTGLQLTFGTSTPLVTSFRFTTANDIDHRDPIAITLEGSNQNQTSLCDASSWTKIYAGSSGLRDTTKRKTRGSVQLISDNLVQYRTYRLLVTEKRSYSFGVQYAEIELFGFA